MLKTLLLVSVLCGTLFSAEVRIALIVKNLGNGFFEAARDGAQLAAKEIGGIKIIYTGPAVATAEGQIDIMNSLIAQKVDAIAISSNDPDALIPVSKKAMRRGIKVISWDSAVGESGRIVHLNPSSAELIGRKQVQMMAETLNYKGEIAILSATAQAANQNTWISFMKDELKKDKYKDMKLVSVVYGDDNSDKSYKEALGLFKSFPNLRGIISPTTAGITASAKAVEDKKLIGKVYVSGLGLPSEMAGYVHSGAVDNFAIWNPIDLGYTAVYLANAAIQGKLTGAEGEAIKSGHMGTVSVEKNKEATMAEPFVYNKGNVDKFKKIF